MIHLTPEEYWKLRAYHQQLELTKHQAAGLVARAEAALNDFLWILAEAHPDFDVTLDYTANDASLTLDRHAE